MYQITCDGYVLYDPRDDELRLINPKCKLKVNTVGESSFTILANHPNYDKLQKLQSMFEIKQDSDVIFRGRMTSDSKDFENRKDVDLEGALAFTNDTIIPPFKFPDDFPDAASAENVVEYFLQWIIDTHNEHAQSWQRLKVGRVTVADPNNNIERSSTAYSKTWEILKSKLFDSSLGGYLCIRYENDGNYVDYLKEFENDNSQEVKFGENLLDLTNLTDASETYSVILPFGAKLEDEETETSDETSQEEKRLTLADLPDGDISEDLVKEGLYLYSRSAVAKYGWICAPVDKSTWDDVTEADNLLTKSLDYLTGTAMLLLNTITAKALDLNFTDKQIQSFRIYRNVLVSSAAHGLDHARFPLPELDIDILSPQNTLLTIGDTVRTMLDINSKKQSSTVQYVGGTIKPATESKSGLMSSPDKVKLNSIEENANYYVHPDTPGNLHIPIGGSAGQILRWNGIGAAVWSDESGATIYNNVGGCTNSVFDISANFSNGLATVDVSEYIPDPYRLVSCIAQFSSPCDMVINSVTIYNANLTLYCHTISNGAAYNGSVAGIRCFAICQV